MSKSIFCSQCGRLIAVENEDGLEINHKRRNIKLLSVKGRLSVNISCDRCRTTNCYIVDGEGVRSSTDALTKC